MIAVETDLRTKAAGPSLADLMLNRGATLPRVAPRNIEQAVTKAEQAAELVDDEAVDTDAPVAADAPCSHHSCAWAIGDECRCYGCLGAGHGYMTKLVADAARARFTAKVNERHNGDVFATIPAAPADDPTPYRVPGLAAIRFDADGWPID